MTRESRPPCCKGSSPTGQIAKKKVKITLPKIHINIFYFRKKKSLELESESAEFPNLTHCKISLKILTLQKKKKI